MVSTRSMSRKANANAKKRSYARSVKKSHCRGKGRATCRRTSGCKYTQGKKRTFCRKSKNTSHKMKGGFTTHFNKQHSLDKHAAPVKA